MEIILRGGRLIHAHDPDDIRGPDLTKCGMRLRPGWRVAPEIPVEEWSEDQDCERCDRRFEFEEYVIAVGGSLRPDGSGTMDIP